MLYSFNGNEPTELPHRIRMPDGTTRTTPISREDLLVAGYYPVSEMPVVDQTKIVQWDSENIEWKILDKTQEQIAQEAAIALEEQWDRVHVQRDGLLKEFDWRVSRYESQLRLGISTTDSITDLDTYAQALRDITLQDDPFNIIWPDQL